MPRFGTIVVTILKQMGFSIQSKTLIYQYVFWSVGYLTGAFCGLVESWYFCLNCMVFVIVCCIVVVLDLFLVLQSALGPNFFVICWHWSVAISACCSFISVLSIVFWHCFRGNRHHWIVLPCRFIGKRRYSPLISACRQKCDRKFASGLRISFISAWDKKKEWQFASWTAVPCCERGPWQWPKRGLKIGEASNPGPPTPATQGDNRTPQPSINRNCWAQLDSIDLESELRKRVRTIRDPPRWFRRPLRRACMVSFHEWRRNKSARSWKLFILTARMLLRPTEEQGPAGKLEFEDRTRLLAGQWCELLREASDSTSRVYQKMGNLSLEEQLQKRRKEAEQKVRLKELSRARTHLTSLGLAPGTPETLVELTNEAKRPPACTEAFPLELLNFQPDAKVILEPNLLENVL